MPPAKKMGMKEAIVVVLEEADGALHYRDITSRIRRKNLIESKGKTLEQSVSAKLATCAKREDTFKRTAPGVYGLRVSARRR